MCCVIIAPERLEMNVTSALVDITKRTAALWSSRFFNNELLKEEKRAPFLPFLLRNKTGTFLSSLLIKNFANSFFIKIFRQK